MSESKKICKSVSFQSPDFVELALAALSMETRWWSWIEKVTMVQQFDWSRRFLVHFEDLHLHLCFLASGRSFRVGSEILQVFVVVRLNPTLNFALV